MTDRVACDEVGCEFVDDGADHDIRTSTLEQVAGFEAQDRDLRTAGVERTFQEQVSSVAARPQLEAALDFVRDGDIFVVTKLDRLARSVANMLEIVARLEKKGVALATS